MKDTTQATPNPEVVAENSTEPWGPTALEERRQRSARHLTGLAARRAYWIDQNRYYYDLLARLLRFLVEPGSAFFFFAATPAICSRPCVQPTGSGSRFPGR